MNNVCLVGRLTRDPELRYIPHSGTPVATFTLAVDKGLSKEKKEEMESQNKPTADFLRIVVWGKQGENCAEYLKKGRQTSVNGRLQTGSYEDKDGKKVYTTDVVANQVQFLDSANGSNGNGNSQNRTQKSEPAQAQTRSEDSFNDFGGGGFPFGNDDDMPF